MGNLVLERLSKQEFWNPAVTYTHCCCSNRISSMNAQQEFQDSVEIYGTELLNQSQKQGALEWRVLSSLLKKNLNLKRKKTSAVEVAVKHSAREQHFHLLCNYSPSNSWHLLVSILLLTIDRYNVFSQDTVILHHEGSKTRRCLARSSYYLFIHIGNSEMLKSVGN